MKIDKYSKFEDITGNEFLLENAPIFSHQVYADWLKKTENRDYYWLVGEENGNTLLLPFTVSKKAVFKIGQFQTHVIWMKGTPDASIEKDFLNKVVDFIGKEKLCDWIQSPPNWAIFDQVPDKSISAPFGTYLIDLQTPTLEEIFANFRKDCRNNIRKAEKEGLEVRRGNDQLPQVYELLENVAKKGRQFLYSYDYYKEYLQHFKNNVLLYVTYQDDEPQIGKLRLVSRYSSYGLGAGRIDSPAKGAGNLTTWVEIQELKDLGIQYYDFVGARIDPVKGSKQFNIQLFKESFGAELKRGHLWKHNYSEPKFFAYDSLLRVKLAFSGVHFKGDIIDQERPRFYH